MTLQMSSTSATPAKFPPPQLDDELLDWDFRLDVLPPATTSRLITVNLIHETPEIQPE